MREFRNLVAALPADSPYRVLTQAEMLPHRPTLSNEEARRLIALA